MNTLSFKNDNPSIGKILLALFLSFLFVIAYLISFRFLPSIDKNMWADVLFKFFYRVVFSVVCIIIIKFVFKIKIGFTKKNLLSGFFIYGIIMVIYVVSNFIGSSSAMDKTFKEGIEKAIVYFIMCLGIGIVEETLFRIFTFNLLKKAFGKGKINTFFAIIISSLIFGLAHINNLFGENPTVHKTIAQVVYAFFIGTFFTALYDKSENILPCIIYHALYDYAFYFWFSFSSSAITSSKTDISLLSMFIEPLWELPLFIFAILLYFNVFDKIILKIRGKV